MAESAERGTVVAEKRAENAARPPLKQAFRALQNPNYRYYWIGQIISAIGTWMQTIAQAWLVLQLTNSPLALGLVTTCQTLPVLFLVLFGGVFADRLPKRRLLLITQTTMLLQAALLAVLTAGGWMHLSYLYILAAILGIASALDNPTRSAFVKELVGPDDVANAVALNSLVMNAARLTGPAIAGVVIAVVGVSGCFALNAASFVAAIAALLLMRSRHFFDVPMAARGKMLAQISEGLRYTVRTPEVALVMILMAALGTFGYNFTIVLPLIAQYVLHAGSIGFGSLSSAVAVGSLIAALGLAYTGKATQRTLLIGAAGFSTLLFCLGLSHWWVMTIPVLIVLGMFSITYSTTASSRLQMLTPPQLRGRVMSLLMLFWMGTTPIGALVIGTLAQRQGVEAAVMEAAGLCMLGTITGALYIRRKRAHGAASMPGSSLPDASSIPS